MQLALAATRVAVVDLQCALLKDAHALTEFRPVLGKIAAVANSVRDRGGRPIDFSDLRSDDTMFVALALAKLVSHRSNARQSLPLLQQEIPELRELEIPIAPPVDAPVGKARQHGMPWHSRWHSGQLTIANIMASVAAVLASKRRRSTNWLATLSWQAGASLAAGLAGVYASYVRLCQPRADRTLVARALQGQIGIEDYRAYYRQMATFGIDASRYPAPRAFDSVTNAELIAEFSVTGGEPAFSGRRMAWRMLKKFQKEVGLISIGHAQRGDRSAWDKMAATASLSLLNHLGSKMHVMHPQRLEQLKELIAQGKKVIIYANHRSDLDTLVLCAMLRGCGIRNVVKDVLAPAPGLGQTSAIHPLAAFNPFVDTTKRWHDDATLYTSILTERRREAVDRMVADCMVTLRRGENESILINPGATRHETPVAGVEAGMLPLRGGLNRLLTAAHAEWGDDVYLVPAQMAGVGSIMSSDYGRLLRHGVGINRTIVMGVGEPYKASSIMEELADGPFARADAATKARFINSRLYARSATGLFEMQQSNRSWPTAR